MNLDSPNDKADQNGEFILIDDSNNAYPSNSGQDYKDDTDVFTYSDVEGNNANIKLTSPKA